MLFKGLLATSMSGKVDGVVASRNKGGAYFRNRSMPVNPNTARQQTIRGRFGNLQTRWRDVLTAQQRTEWEGYATVTTKNNRIGDARVLQGKNWYTGGNILLADAGIAYVDDGPGDFGLADLTEPDNLSVDTAAQELDFDIDGSDPLFGEDGAALNVYISRPQPLSVNSYSGSFQLAGSVLGSSTSAPTGTQTVSLPFPAAAGSRLFVRFKGVRADARQTPQFRTLVGVT